jgi:hypothetical protein
MTTAAGASRAREAIEFALATLFVIMVAGAAAMTRADVDLWGHVRFGLDILDQGRIASADPYSFTSDRAWINHEWLAEVVFAAAWRVAGNTGLIAIKAASIAGTLLLVLATLRNRGVSVRPRLILAGFTLAGILQRVTHVRPQLFSVLLFAALLFILHGARERSPGFRRLLLASPLLALWANLHGGWIVGLATLGLSTLGLAWERRARGWRAALVLLHGVLAAAATLLNPYGAGLWTFLMETVRLGRQSISEWGPIWLDPAALLVWALFGCLTAWALTHRRPEALAAGANPARFWIPVFWGLASLRVSRLDSFFVLSVVMLLGPALEAFFRGRAVAPAPSVRVPTRIKAAIVAALVVVAAAIPRARQTLTCVEVYGPWWPEPEATAFMNEHRVAGRMVTFFRWGEYGIWNLPAGVKVSMDGRRETVYTDRVVSGHLELYDGTAAGLAYLRSLDADFVWFPRFLPVTAGLQQQGWVPIFEGPASVLLASPVRAAPFGGAVAHARALPGNRCFPGP